MNCRKALLTAFVLIFAAAAAQAQDTKFEFTPFLGYTASSGVDTAPLDNRTVRDLTTKYPAVYFLCLSSKRFHPELKDAICYRIYACINKPMDPEELFFCLKSIYADSGEAGAEK